MSAHTPINPFPPRWIGLWRVKNSPYYYKERWPEADFGDRWRSLKARVRGRCPSIKRADDILSAACALSLDHDGVHIYAFPEPRQAVLP